MVEAGDEEVAADEATDEFAAHFAAERPPNVLLTTSQKPSKIMFDFLSEMIEVGQWGGAGGGVEGEGEEWRGRKGVEDAPAYLLPPSSPPPRSSR